MSDLYPDQMIHLASTPFPATFPGILQSVHRFVTFRGKRHKVDKCCDLAGTSRIVYHSPPALSMQGRKQGGLDYVNLFDGSFVMSLQRKHVNKHSKHCVYTDQLYSTFPSGQVPQSTQCTTFIYHWKKLYYLST